MEDAPENGKESSHSAHASGMNGWMNISAVPPVEIYFSFTQLSKCYLSNFPNILSYLGIFYLLASRWVQ